MDQQRTEEDRDNIYTLRDDKVSGNLGEHNRSK